MPELPEIETIKNGITPHIEGQIIKKIEIRHYGLRWPIQKNIADILQNKKIVKISRRAKYLLLQCDAGTLIIHLGMSGSLRILTKPISPKKHDHVDIVFANHKILRFNDPRRFGAFLWTDKNIDEHELFKHLGVEPLSKEFSGKYLFKKAEGKKLPIKSFIMHNAVVVGVGNIYAAEALFLAKIHPKSEAGAISLLQYQVLAKSIKKILQLAIKQGGTTLKDFINSDGKPGYFTNYLKVYGRENLPCVVCGKKLIKVVIGQRSTVFCENCQK